MVKRPKDIGTAAETAVLRILKPWFPDADRGALTGSHDQGDIRHCGDFIFEVKGGAQTKQIGDKLLEEWAKQTAVEALNSGRYFGVLVVQRHGFGAGRADRWWAYVPIHDLVCWCGGYSGGRSGTVMVRLELGQLLNLLAENGYTFEVDVAA